MIFRYDDKKVQRMFRRARGKNGLNNRVVITSGFYDPVHAGHISYFKDIAEKVCKPDDVFIVVLNGDKQAEIKKGKSFMPVEDRAIVLDSLKYIDHVFIYDNPKAKDSIEPINLIRPRIFAKGFNLGEDLPEQRICDRLGVEIVRQLGDEKTRSSSNYLADWVNFVNMKQ